MIQYPLTFKVSSLATGHTSTAWKSCYYPTTGEAQWAAVAIPPEFDGPGGGYSPEDFYALALLNCFVATFKVIAEKSKLDFKDFNCEGRLTVDRDEKGAPWMSAFKINGTLTGVVDAERARRILEKTSQSCMVLNSVKTVKTFEWTVEGVNSK